MTDAIEPSNAEQAEWSDMTRDWVAALQASAERAEAERDAIVAVTLERAAQIAEAHMSKIEINEPLWHDGQDWAAESIALAIRALSPEPPHVAAARLVKVKPLNWFEAELPSRGGGKLQAEGYTVRRIEGKWLLDFAGTAKHGWWWSDLDAAKAAAQADYTARIREALEGDPT